MELENELNYLRNEKRKEVTVYYKFFAKPKIKTIDYSSLDFDYLTSSFKEGIIEIAIRIPNSKFEIEENGNQLLYPDPDVVGGWIRRWKSPRQNFWFIANEKIKNTIFVENLILSSGRTTHGRNIIATTKFEGFDVTIK